jgi:hypothetical protein
MNPYSHKQIENSLDVRLVDLFVKQNPGNDWISIDDAAAWVYETNTVKPHHKRYVVHKMMRIIGSMYTQEEQDSFLESGYIDVDGSPEYAYRLKGKLQKDSNRSKNKEIIRPKCR